MHEDLVDLIKRSNVAFPKTGSGVAPSTIKKAEDALGLALPESYKWWLLTYGGGQIKSDIVYGLAEEREPGVWEPDITDLAELNQREGLKNGSMLVFSTGNGEEFYFDTSRMENGEYRVFLHEFAESEPVYYAKDFAEFLRKRIRELYGLGH